MLVCSPIGIGGLSVLVYSPIGIGGLSVLVCSPIGIGGLSMLGEEEGGGWTGPFGVPPP